ncbi:Coatomer subunit delta [Lachnellula suecica]|uniref:Coatomer subunit delta n=1 Tax=Lachnellula suecica TaxID=602035 RepID=A0A8T9CDF0_9HELO|nr:Coatomer subunit delta [Lachnellula suecica]
MEMQRSRVEALLASFPKLADTGTQHTTVEQDNVRFVYQPLDELYMVLITNRQSNILQDIDSLHLFAQVVTSTCKTLDEREILKNAYELLSAFDELVTLGYRENLTISQIKTFLEMESHEERIQEIISRNKELEATEERKRRAKQLEMQRKEVSRSGRNAAPRTPVYPTYTPPARSTVTDTYDSYEAEKNKSFKTSAPKGKGMQLGKKSKTTDMFERVRGDLGPEAEETVASPLVQPIPAAAEHAAPRGSTSMDRDAIHVTIAETINAKLSREGSLNSLEIKGDLQLKISDPSLTKVKLDLVANASHGVQFRTHPNVDKALFNSSKAVQMTNATKGFPVNNSVGVLRWRATPKVDDASAVPITFTVWVNKGSDDTYNITVEYELTGGDPLKDVTVIIPYASSEPAVSSFDATYEVSGDSLEWTIGLVDDDNATGSFEFEAQAGDENEFFPMQVKFGKSKPFIDVDVTDVTLLEMDESVTFSKEISLNMANSLTLEVLSEKSLQQAADPNLINYCPSMDLIALTTTDQQVLIYRLNGQRVYGAAQKAGQLKVESIRWKPNGKLLAIAWSDGSVRLVGAESSKIVHQFAAGEDVTGITCLGWSSNITGKSSKSERKSDATWGELLGNDEVLAGNKIPLDLPRDLALIDIERSLPKLSVLAAGGASDDVFCSRASLDALFRPFDPKDNNAVDVMIVGTKEGQIHLSIYDSFIVGSFPAPSIGNAGPSHLVFHSSHEQCSSHTLLVKSPGSDILYYVPMDLRFISTSSDNLSLLASRSTNLQNLLRYIDQVQLLMVGEWKSTQELPGKFVRNINETLGELHNGDWNIVQALYHSVATGHTVPCVKEWLVDELAERGHKRWEKAVTTGLENLRKLVHENLLPALERCSVILSRFSGIAKFQGPNDTVGFSSQQISLIMDTVACLHLVASRILIQVVDELDLFGAFSAWLRFEIDRLASEGSIALKDEEAEKEATIDHSKVLLYLQNCMDSSPLEVYLGDCTSEDYSNGWSHAEQGLPMFDLLEKQSEKQEKGLPYMKPLPRVELLCKFLSKQAKIIFAQIAEAEKRNVLLGNPQEIGVAESDGPKDVTVIKVEARFQTHIAFTPKGLSNTIHVTRVAFEMASGISTVQSIESAAIQLGNGQIKDIKFFDSASLLILWDTDGKRKLLKIPFSAINDYVPYSKRSPPRPKVVSQENVVHRFSEFKIPDVGAIVPERLDIRGQSSKKGHNSTRILVLGKDRLHYKVFKLAAAHSPRGPADADEDTSMS